jgi:DNA primase
MTSFLDVLSAHHLNPKLASSGSEIVIKCPLCDDHAPRLYVNATTGMWMCHLCKETGNDYTLLREVLGLDHFMAMRLRARLDGGQASISRPTPAYTRQQRGPSLEEGGTPAKEGIELPDECHPLTHPEAPGEGIFWRYLESRGVTAKDVKTYEIGWCLRGLYAYRIIIPVKTNDVLWTFVARSVVDATPKVLHPVGAQPLRALFGLDQFQESNKVIVVEGAFDALRLQGRAVATLGTNFSQHQRQLLHDRGITEIILLWDGDEVGRHAAALVAGQLISTGFTVAIALLPEGRDPASATTDEINQAGQSATLPSFLSQKLLAKTLDFLTPVP